MTFYVDQQEREWIKELEKLLAFVGYQHRITFSPQPIISLTNNTRALGSYDPNNHVIHISKQLIEKYPWPIVCEIFKHEIAHLIAVKFFGCHEAHGKAFHDACERIAVEHWARKAQVDMEDSILDWREQKLSSEEEKLQRKVEKLLALSTSSNENEALLAMKLVKDLLQKHNIETSQKTANEDYVCLFITHKTKRMESFKWSIAHILQNHYFVKVLQTNLYDALHRETYQAFEIVGTKNNVLMAEYVYWFLFRKIDELWKLFAKQNNKKGIVARNNYYLGLLSGFADKLKQAEQSFTQATNQEQLMLIKNADRQLENYYNKRHPKISTVGSSRRYYDEESYAAGKTDGKSIHIHQPISSSQKSGLYLT